MRPRNYRNNNIYSIGQIKMSIKLNKKIITVIQINALNNIEIKIGRSWKAELINAWSTGNYRSISTNANEVAYLHSLRNILGRVWLNSLVSKELKTVWSQYGAK